MPNRILKESICTSDSIDQLSAFEETVFYRLIVNCDDFGRFDGRPKIIASKLFPLKDIRINQIESALRTLTSAELVILYEVDGKPFLQMKTWDRHQQIRAKKSKYPAPESGNITSDSGNNASDIICNQLISNDIKCPRNPIQSESNPNPNARKERARESELLFERFWGAYPRKEAKTVAKKAFEKLAPDESLLLTMLEAIEQWKKTAQWQEDGGKYIPHPASWLNQRRWEDDMPKAESHSAKTVHAQDYEQRDYSGKEETMEEALERLRGMGMIG